jgi:hypothetical protein
VVIDEQHAGLTHDLTLVTNHPARGTFSPTARDGRPWCRDTAGPTVVSPAEPPGT